jgi:type VI secretion system secreted protein VgrG
MPDMNAIRDHALLSMTCPLGKTELIPVSAVIDEAINQPFLCTIEAVSRRPTIDPDTLLCQPACLSLVQYGERVRSVHGLVRRVSALGRQDDDTFRYRLEVVPKLWFLAQTEDCRIFQDKSCKDILEQVLLDAGISDYGFSVANGEPRPLTVQFNETSLAFFTRIVEDAGWCFTFRHSDASHKLLIADSIAALATRPALPVERSGETATGTLADWQDSHGTAWGRRELGDYSAEEFKMEGGSATTLKAAGADRRTAFHWPSGVSGGQIPSRARQDMEAAEAAALLSEGAGFDARLMPGNRIAVAAEPGSPRADHVLMRVVHEARDLTLANAAGAPCYRNRFTAHPADVAWRPLRTVAKPRLDGIYSAQVLGGDGEEIHTDDLGRVRLRFQWDHRGDATGGGGVWVRVMQPWAGGGAGWQGIPRVGSEVAVSFMDADPDRPVVLGQLYNKSDTPPFPPASQKTRTGLRTRSTPNGGSQDYSEFYFDDKKDQELVFLHAQKDLTVEVENDAAYAIEQNRAVTVRQGNDTLSVLQGNRTVSVEQGNDKLTVAQGNRTVAVPLGNHSITSTTGDISVKTDLGAISLEALKSITLKVGQSSITLDPSGVTIKGMTITVEGQVMTSVKAPMLKLDADGLLKAAAGIMMLN